VNELVKNTALTFTTNKNENISQIQNNQKILFNLPLQINANTSEIYKQLKNNFIINNNKKPICKNSLLKTKS